jgi:hypothetical protein
MATRQWLGNAPFTAQVMTFTITGAANAATISVTINGLAITYALTGGDTNATAAAALQALLTASTLPEFQEVTWTVSTNVITGTATTAGTPFTATGQAAGGTTNTVATPTANSSPNDVNIATNWSGGAVPVNGDDIVFQDNSVSALWSLSALAAVTGTVTVWQNYTGQIGLPENNPLGYAEYRPTYFQANPSTLTIGVGSRGNGSGLMQFNVGSVTCAITVINTGANSPGTDYALRLLGTSASNTLKQNGGTIGIAMLPSEVATFSTITVQNGSAELGSGVTLTTANCNGGTLTLRGTCTTLTVTGGTASLNASGTYTTVVAQNQSTILWSGAATITTLTLSQGSRLDVSGDTRAKTITNSTVTGDSVVNDPYSAITWTNATTITGPITAGVFILGPGRTMKVV